MILSAILLLAVLLLSYYNGANDISKGIATMAGSGTVKDRTAIWWGTVTTILGALLATGLTSGLMRTFSNGIVTQPITSAAFPLTVALGACGWLFVATTTGLPVSTTHALTGGLAGAGVALFGVEGVAWSLLLKKIALPLAISPVVSFGLAQLLFPLTRFALSRVRQYCVCMEVQQIAPVVLSSGALALQRNAPEIVIDKSESCMRTVSGPLQLNVIDGLHWLTSGLTSFARGMNDTPKIAALLVGLQLTAAPFSNTLLFALVAFAMMLGGLMNGQRVLHTMARKITSMDAVQGFTANVGSAALILTGTFYGLPFSTTHVTTSAIVGVGTRTKSGASWNVVRDILLAWLVTLPVAAVIAYVIGLVLRNYL
ncbi:MAG: inorganic phosphate transporter [candidate division KSB1 bacterium]